MTLKTILIRENERKSLAPEELKKLKAYLRKNKLEKRLDVRIDEIKAKNYVGVIRCKNIQIEILPKYIAKEDAPKDAILANLIFMLSYTKKLNIDVPSNATLNKCANPFLEILIGEFAKSLFEGLKKFSPKNYIRIEENIGFVKGKIDFSSNIKHNLTNKAKFYCQFDEFTENNPINQLFLFVSRALFLITNNNRNKKTLQQIINYYVDIDEVYFDKFSVKKIKLTRNQMLFEKPFNLAKMFIENSSIDMTKNKIDNISLIWDMNKLFEEFVYEIMRRNCNFEICAQKGRRLLEDEDENGGTYRDTKVDIFAKIDKETKIAKEKIIIDTKYKEMTTDILRNLCSNDIYQVSTYCLLHSAKKAVLIYPKWREDDINKNFVIRSVEECNRYKIKGSDEEDNRYKIKVCNVDLRKGLNRTSVLSIAKKILEQIEKFEEPLLH